MPRVALETPRDVVEIDGVVYVRSESIERNLCDGCVFCIDSGVAMPHRTCGYVGPYELMNAAASQRYVGAFHHGSGTNGKVV